MACQTKTACGNCPGCKQGKQFTHPDILVLEDKEGKVAMAHVQLLREKLARGSWHGQLLVIIPEAERLRPDSNNALLKTLEEVTSGTRILLTTAFASRLLPTLRSRCQIIRLANVKETSAFSAGQLATILEEHKRGGLDDNELQIITGALEHERQAGASDPLLTRGYLRLRDYYKIRSQGGNVALAADVLVASLLHWHHTRNTTH